MLKFITSSQNKIDVARKFLSPLEVKFESIAMDLPEIQSHSIEDIAKYKATYAFQTLQEPLFVNDHGWFITALNGFPGAYMKFINEWFTPQDCLNLMRDKENREVTFTTVICYRDSETTKVFESNHKGIILHESRGKGLPWTTVITITEDNQTIAEKLEKGPSALSEDPIWQDFATWLKENNKL